MMRSTIITVITGNAGKNDLYSTENNTTHIFLQLSLGLNRSLSRDNLLQILSATSVNNSLHDVSTSVLSLLSSQQGDVFVFTNKMK